MSGRSGEVEIAGLADGVIVWGMWSGGCVPENVEVERKLRSESKGGEVRPNSRDREVQAVGRVRVITVPPC